MDELSIKEKASRYDEAIEVINKCKTDKYGCIIGVKPTDIFPELNENEDEKIRQDIIRIVDIWTNSSPVVNGIPSETLLAWLEKKGEQKPTDKVEPKFKVGYKIRRKTPSSFDTDMQVARIDKDYYICNHIGKFSSEVVPFSEESSYELIEQKPAAWLEKKGEQKISFSLPTEGEFPYNNPADTLDGEIENIWEKLSCDNKFTATKDGFHEVVVHFVNWYEKQGEQNPAWSKKDDRTLDGIIEEIEANKSNAPDYDIPAYDRFLSFLKSIKDRVQPQNTWKPSKHELEVLKLVAEKDGACLMGLYEQLKKLKEE